MGMNETPSADRVHIGFFGRRNAGKSSIVNKVTGQELAVVSDVKGTTTDPVSKAMELLPMGPVVIIDTPGIDDEGHLGELRVRKAKQVLNRVDVAVLVVQDALTLVVKLVVWVVWGHVAAVAVVLARGLVVLSVREVAKVLLLPAAVVDVLPLVVGHQDPAHVLLAGRDVRIVA